MFDFLKSGFFKSALSFGSMLGVDIGTTTIKVVELANIDDRPKFKNYGILETYGHLARSNSAIQTSSLSMDENETANLLRQLIKDMKPAGSAVFASLPPFSAFSTLLEIPVMPKNEMDNIMSYQAKSLVPMAVSEVSVEWSVVGEFEDEKGQKKQRIFLAAIPNKTIQKYRTIFQKAGLNLRSLELEGISSARALSRNDEEPAIIIDIGGRSTSFSVVQKGQLLFSSYIYYAGATLSQAIANGLGINIKRAEDLKKRRGLLGKGGEYELSTLMLPYVDVILNEARRVKENSEKNYRIKVEKFILSGGGGELLGLSEYATDFLKAKVEKPNPFISINYEPALQPVIGDLGGELAVPIGLSLHKT